MRQKSTDKAIMSLRDRKIWLSDAVRTPLGEIDENHPLCTEMTATETGTKIKKADPLKSMDILNKLEGDYAAEKVELSALDSFFDRIKPEGGLHNETE